MPRTCILLLLDGLGDRACPELDGLTPLQAAPTPNLDALAAAGSAGLYHPGLCGQAMPSELAHFLLFGYPEHDFPGRGALEAAGVEMALSLQDVAFMARLVHVRDEAGTLRLMEDTPTRCTPEELSALAAAVTPLETHGLRIEYRHIKGLHGLLTVRPGEHRPSPDVTDTNPIRAGAFCIEPRPLAESADPEDAARTARALKHFLARVYAALHRHPVNADRMRRGISPVNALMTQRAGRPRTLVPFRERYGLRSAILASTALYRGLAHTLGMEFHHLPDTDDPGPDLAHRLEEARRLSKKLDFIHVHTKAPDVAAHTKDPRHKRDVIAALDAAIGAQLRELATDPDVLLAVTADHSTPSTGSLIHSGEPVPVLLHGAGVRCDAVSRFDEIAVSPGCLGLLRGPELMLMILQYLDRARLLGLRDTPAPFAQAPGWPGDYAPFSLHPACEEFAP